MEDAYEAFCLDEACAYIIQQIEDGNEPLFKKKYNSFKEMYEKYK